MAQGVHRVILNDKKAMEESVEKNNFHGEIIASCKMGYNDESGAFRKWHSELKGGESDYEKERRKRTSTSRLRKTKATLIEIVFIVISKEELSRLDIMKQGRNSDGRPRKEKYKLDFKKIKSFNNEKLQLNGI